MFVVRGNQLNYIKIEIFCKFKYDQSESSI